MYIISINISADIPREPYLALGMGQLHAYNSNKPLPRLFFTPAVEGNHPRMKSLIEEMVTFDANERMEISTVKASIKNVIIFYKLLDISEIYLNKCVFGCLSVCLSSCLKKSMP